MMMERGGMAMKLGARLPFQSQKHRRPRQFLSASSLRVWRQASGSRIWFAQGHSRRQSSMAAPQWMPPRKDAMVAP